MDSEHRMGGMMGCFLIKTVAITPADGKQFEAIYVREASTITVLSGKDAQGNAVDFLLAAQTNIIAGTALIQGDLITVPEGAKITAITLTAGSAWGY